MDLIKRVWAIPWHSEPWRDGFLWLGWNVFAGLLPLWGTAGLLFLFGQDVSLFSLLKNGEFVLYSASFIGGAMYVIRKDIFPSKNFLTILLVSFLAISLLVFVAITVTTLGNKPEWLTVSKDALTSISIVVIIISVISCFIITVAESDDAGINIPRAIKQGEVDLEAGLDEFLKAAQKEKNNG